MQTASFGRDSAYDTIILPLGVAYAAFARQCAGTQEYRNHGLNQRFRAFIDSPFTLFVQFGSLRLLSFPKSQKMTHQSKMQLKRGDQRRRVGVFCRTSGNTNCGRETLTEISLH